MAETCPKCGYAQVQTDECPRCRVTLSKYRAYLGRLGQPPAKATAVAAAVAAVAPSEVVDGPPAGFWIRFVASLIDSIVFWVVGFAVGLGTGLTRRAAVEEIFARVPGMAFFFLLLVSLYYIIFHRLWGQTIGKMLLRIRVVRVDGTPLSLGHSILRFVGYFVSYLTLSIGYLMAAFRADKRALHDLLAGTRVVRL